MKPTQFNQVPPLGHKFLYQPTNTSVSKPADADAMPMYVGNLPVMIPKPQQVPEIRNFSQDRGGGGKAA